MRRVMLKLSGEALSGAQDYGFDNEEIDRVCNEIKEALKNDIQLLIVVGGGNFIRGRMISDIDKYRADEIGMLSTCMNALYLSERLRKLDLKTYICGGFQISDMVHLLDKDEVINKLEEGNIVICAGGTGSSYFTTDTGVVLRALQFNCTELLLAKSVDGVYDKDPSKSKDAKKYDKITLDEILDKKLEVIDKAASALAYDNKLSMRIFSMLEDKNIVKAIKGENIGTLVTL